MNSAATDEASVIPLGSAGAPTASVRRKRQALIGTFSVIFEASRPNATPQYFFSNVSRIVRYATPRFTES